MKFLLHCKQNCRANTCLQLLPSADFAHRAFEQTGGDSMISKYAIRSLLYVIQSKNDDGWRGKWSTSELTKTLSGFPDALHEYLLISRCGTPGDPRKSRICRFHLHAPNSECRPHQKKRICPQNVSHDFRERGEIDGKEDRCQDRLSLVQIAKSVV